MLLSCSTCYSFFFKLRLCVTCVEPLTLIFFGILVIGHMTRRLLVTMGKAGSWLGAPGEGRVDRCLGRFRGRRVSLLDEGTERGGRIACYRHGGCGG